MKKLIIGVVVVGLFFTACTKEEETTGGTAPVEELRLLGSVSIGPDFQNTGNFDLNLLALDANDNVIQLSGSQISMILDSVATTTKDTTYQVIVRDVTFVQPSAGGKIKVGILLDSSGSMDWNDPNYLRRDASRDFIELLLQNSASHKVGIFDFAARYGDVNGDSIDDYYLRVLQDFVYVTDTAGLFAALDSVTAYGGTPLYLSLWYLLDHVHDNIEAGYGHAILVLTDGEDNESGDITSDSVITKALNYQIPIYAIGLGDTSYIDFTELQRVASLTGGVYANAADANALTQIFNSMGLGLSQGYNRIAARITPVPPSGSRIWGRVRATSGGKTAETGWSFTAP